MSKIRLFDNETEICTHLGGQVAMVCDRAMEDLVKRVLEIEPQVCLRDVETLAVQEISMRIAREILKWRREYVHD